LAIAGVLTIKCQAFVCFLFCCLHKCYGLSGFVILIVPIKKLPFGRK
jgi:hypothetical protein